jgi:peroxiredoxin
MEEVPLLKELHARYANQATIIGVSVDTSLERVDRVMKEKAMTWPILADGNGFDGPIPKAYHIQGTPELFVLDREGKILARLGSAKQLEARLKEALNAPDR